MMLPTEVNHKADGSSPAVRDAGGQNSRAHEGVIPGRLRAKPGGVAVAPIAAGAAVEKGRAHARLRMFVLASWAACLAACSSSTGSTSSNSQQSLAQVKREIIKAWRAAENAFYRAEAQVNGASSPSLAATMVDPELSLVRRNLQSNAAHELIGHGTWNLGTPSVVALQPNEPDPSSATVKSCIDDSAILVSRSTGEPVPGIGGMPDWEGETSIMVLSQGTWKLSSQSAVVNTLRTVACHGR
jgi:hypothetical protein